MRNIFDSHAHYDDSQFNPDREELLGHRLDDLRLHGTPQGFILIFQAVIPAPGIPDIDVDSGIGLGLDGGKIAGTQRRKGDGRNTPIPPADIGIVNACKIQLLLGLA